MSFSADEPGFGMPHPTETLTLRDQSSHAGRRGAAAERCHPYSGKAGESLQLSAPYSSANERGATPDDEFTMALLARVPCARRAYAPDGAPGISRKKTS